tara:strand:- start:8569 stop:8703 length:135 start_codon:yes stop_codon:yes gene_type:complete
MICVYCEKKLDGLDESHGLCSSDKCIEQIARDYEMTVEEVKKLL